MPKVCYAITLRGFLVNLDYSRNIKVICLYKPRKEEFVQINPSLKYLRDNSSGPFFPATL